MIRKVGNDTIIKEKRLITHHLENKQCSRISTHSVCARTETREDQQTNKIDTPKPSNVPQHEQKQPVSVSNIKSGTSYSEMHMSADINNLQRVVPNFVPEFLSRGIYQMPGNHVEEKDVQSENVRKIIVHLVH